MAKNGVLADGSILFFAVSICNCSYEKSQRGSELSLAPAFQLALASSTAAKEVLSFYALVNAKETPNIFLDLQKDPPDFVTLPRGKITAKALVVMSNEDAGLCPEVLSFFSSEASLEADLRKNREQRTIDLPQPKQSKTLQVKIRLLRKGVVLPQYSVSLANPLSQTALSSRCLSSQGSSSTNQSGELNIETPVLGTWPLSWTVFDATIKQNVFFSLVPSSEVINAAKIPKDAEKPEISLELDLATKTASVQK